MKQAKSQQQMVSPEKILYHRKRLEAFIRGKSVFPVTLELGITTRCNRWCPDCPSRLGAPGLVLKLETIKRLFAILATQTRGLIITGGEPTLSPHFADILRLARGYGFEEIAVISNGTRLDQEKVADALLGHASAVRVSLYDWDQQSFAGVEPTLQRIEWLRQAAEKIGSKLEIGVSALIRTGNSKVLKKIAVLAMNAGAHWIYFHPLCTTDNLGTNEDGAGESILSAIEKCQKTMVDHFPVYFLKERFSREVMVFNGYHAAHFILVIAADGCNYLATETKYQRPYMLSDLNLIRNVDFLWESTRQSKINSFTSCDFPPATVRNRGIFYNSLIERMKKNPDAWLRRLEGFQSDEFHLPHIL